MKKQVRFRIRILVIFTFVILLFVNSNDSFAKSINEDEVKKLEISDLTEVDLGMDENSTVGLINGYLDQESVVKDSTSKLKEIRAYMYDNNVPYDGGTLQDAAKEAGFATRDAYINSAIVSEGLSKIAIQRAAETATHGYIAHKRANDSDIYTAEINDKFSFNGEIIAWYGSMSSAFDGWSYGELEDLKASNGFWNMNNGHLHNLINPHNITFGFAEFETKYLKVQLGVSSGSNYKDATSGKQFVGEYNIPVAISNDNYFETIKQTTRLVQPEADLISYDNSKFIDYKKYTVEPSNGKELVKTIFPKTNRFDLVSLEKVTKEIEPVQGKLSLGTKERWEESSQGWKYIKDNEEYAQNEWVWTYIKGNHTTYNWKYFDSKGVCIDQFYKENGKVWLSQSDPTKEYYKGWWTDPVNGYEYYFRETSGSRVTGRQYINGGWMFFRDSGTLAYGWQYYNNAWSYNDPLKNGHEATSTWKWLPVQGKTNVFNWKFFNANGESINQFYEENGKVWLSQSGPNTEYKRGWWTDTNNGHKYYFRQTFGSRVSGMQFIDGNWMFFRDSGTLATGWQMVNGSWKYFRPNSGTMVKGRQYINGRWYNFTQNGNLIGNK